MQLSLPILCVFRTWNPGLLKRSSGSVEINMIIDIGSADSGNELGLVIFLAFCLQQIVLVFIFFETRRLLLGLDLHYTRLSG